jgi:hypothetical protein
MKWRVKPPTPYVAPVEGERRAVWRFALFPTRIGDDKCTRVWLEQYWALQERYLGTCHSPAAARPATWKCWKWRVLARYSSKPRCDL